MNPDSMRRHDAPPGRAGGIGPAAVATWVLSFSLIVYLGLKGGGYDPLVHDQVGIAVWWMALVAVVVGALPRRSLGVVPWTALGLFAAFVAWTALSLSWTESTAKTSADLARVAGYLGIFAIAVLTRVSKESHRLVSAVAAGIVVVAGVGLLSRLHPAWFPDAGETLVFLDDSRERLSYPLNYWNGLAALIAIGGPLVLHVATTNRSALLRGVAAAVLPALVLTIFFTLSRGGIASAVLALLVYLAISSDRLPKILAAAMAAAGGAVLISAAVSRDALQEGLSNAAARQQGDEMIAIVLAVCVVVGLLHAGISIAFLERERPTWMLISPRQALAASVAGVLALVVLAAALDAPGRAADGWDEFKSGGGPGSGAGRLSSVAGQSRYEFWRAAVDENSTRPLEGTGSGTFELWWARNGTTKESVRDTHSLYLQTLGELGVVGLVLLAAFLGTILAAGGRAAIRVSWADRSTVAAALAGCLGFCFTAVVDWMWQIPVLVAALLLLASVLLTAEDWHEGEEGALRWPFRFGFAALAVAAIIAIAVPLASTTLLRQSEARAREGDLPGALEAARSAVDVESGFAPPPLQEALVLEELGRLEGAAEAARGAAERESANWRNWLVLSRIEAERGDAAASVSAYRRARSLNPRSPIFER